MKTEIEEIKTQLKGLEKRLEALATKEETNPEPDKWYHVTEGDVPEGSTPLEWLILYHSKREHGHNYKICMSIAGNDTNGNYRTDDWISGDHKIRPATEEETQSALVAEAKRRGFKEGVTIRVDWYDDEAYTLNGCPISLGHEIYNDGDDTALRMGGACIYSNGKWAEILKDQPITVGGYEVRYDVKTGLGAKVTIGCQTYTRWDVNLLFGCMDGMNIESLKVKGVEVTKEKVSEILKGFEQ